MQKRRTGKSVNTWNPVDAIWEREIPEHRIVSDALWYAANAMIDQNRTNKNAKRGLDHPLSGIPRSSRTLLSGLFVCGECGGKMHVDGRNEGGYRCQRARKKDCWVRATSLKSLTHQNISKAVADAILRQEGIETALVEYIRQLHDSQSVKQVTLNSLQSSLEELELQKSRLLKLILSTDTPAETFNQQMKELEKAIAMKSKQIAELQDELRTGKRTLNEQTIREMIDGQRENLLSMNTEAAQLLRLIVVDKIRAYSYLQYGVEKAVLRAEMTIQLAKLLPLELVRVLQGQQPTESTLLPAITITVDLFEPSLLPKLASKILEIRYPVGKKKLSYKQLAEVLGISDQTAYRATKMALEMREKGITDPYIRLTEAPTCITRWKFRHKEELEQDKPKE